ncbi:MAG TPA: hypothetical protein VFZ23_15820, partial [Pyrinomonadaceae bacterium]
MLKIILGVVAGFVAWSILWVGSDQVLMSLSPDWYGAHQRAFQLAVENGSSFTADTTILIMHIVRAAIVSIISGFIAAVVAGENRKAPLALAVVLLIVGVAVEAYVWNYAPVWYHLLFLIVLVPTTILGGKM